MCGIIGYVGEGEPLPRVRTGLQNLEYRGYDSAGVAVETDGLSVYKQEGRVGDLLDRAPEQMDGDVAIGHTRWSTHGPPTDSNAHPHTGCDDEIAVVHNGIISNYEPIRDRLIDSGHRFASQTDTEIIPHLIEEYLDRGYEPELALRETVAQIDGSYAFAVAIAGTTTVFAARNESPLVLGHGDNGMYLASDVPAFLEYTRDVTYLEDGDIVRIDEETVTLYRDGEAIKPPVETVDWEATAAEKGGYDHYMHKEIHEQPNALRQTISGRLAPERGGVDLEFDFPGEYLDALEQIEIIASGTSYYAGQYATELFDRWAGIPASVTIGSEFAFPSGRDPQRTLGLAVTQSGETADTLSGIQKSIDAGTRTLAVTNTLGSSITRRVDESVFINAGPEIGVAATKTFASQVATLGMVAVDLGRQRGVLPRSQAHEILTALEAVPASVQQVLDREPTVKQAAEEYATEDAFFFIGRQLGYPVALEGALKLKEIAYDHAEGFAAGELKHGPLALVTENTPVLATLTAGTNADETVHNIKEAQARGAPVIGAASGECTVCDVTFQVPDTGVFEPLVATVYWQLFAYHVAALKGRAIDKPRNLAKSVTVE